MLNTKKLKNSKKNATTSSLKAQQYFLDWGPSPASVAKIFKSKIHKEISQNLHMGLNLSWKRTDINYFFPIWYLFIFRELADPVQIIFRSRDLREFTPFGGWKGTDFSWPKNGAVGNWKFRLIWFGSLPSTGVSPSGTK